VADISVLLDAWRLFLVKLRQQPCNHLPVQLIHVVLRPEVKWRRTKDSHVRNVAALGHCRSCPDAQTSRRQASKHSEDESAET